MRCLVLLLSSFGLAFGIQCLNGFTDPDNTGNCYNFHYVSKTRFSGQTWCAGTNATLPTIRNIQENKSVYSRLPSDAYAWLGLTCSTSDPFSCVWDDGTPLRKGDYQNFAYGHPNPSIGNCTSMDLGGGGHSTPMQWLSTSCEATQLAMCEYERGLQYSLCPDGSRYFNGSCYFGMVGNSVNDGINRCKAANGNLASIHSDSENYIVFSVARILEPTDATLLGLTLSNNNYSWSDGTSVDYLNFGFEDKQFGNCVAMALVDRFVQHDQWVNAPCDSSTPVNMICKIPIESITAVVTTPEKCSSSILLNGTGTVVSPGYPNSTLNSCQYLVALDAGQRASIYFSQISLDSNSKITLFNNLFDKNPFATITATKNDTKVYKSTGNSLIMMFTTNGGSGNNFRGIFGQTLSSCQNKDVYNGSGNFTSPNYPGYYPSNLNCEYRLVSSKNRIALTFNKFSTYNSDDSVYIYDGSGTLLKQIYGQHDNFAISSFTNSMRLVFKTSRSYNVGFAAEFISVL